MDELEWHWDKAMSGCQGNDVLHLVRFLGAAGWAGWNRRFCHEPQNAHNDFLSPCWTWASGSLAIGNTRKELQGGLGRGALHLSTSKSSWRENLQHGRDGAESRSPSFIVIWSLSLMLIKPKRWKVWDVSCGCQHSRVYIGKGLTFDVALSLASRRRKWIN